MLLFSLAFASGIPPEPGVFQRLTGMSWQEIHSHLPGTTHYLVHGAQGQAVSRAVFAGLLMGVPLVPYQRGERWAWYVAWSLPAVLALLLTMVLAEGGSIAALLAIFMAVALVGLLLPVRRFFPQETQDRRLRTPTSG